MTSREREQLGDRIEGLTLERMKLSHRLQTFNEYLSRETFKDLDPLEQELLTAQCQAMQAHLDALIGRINFYRQRYAEPLT